MNAASADAGMQRVKKCHSAWVVMTQTKFAVTALDESISDNLSVPYGLIRTVRHYLEFVGVLSYIRSLKSKGVRLDLIVVALCTYLELDNLITQNGSTWSLGRP